jgi:hypothetical protein
MRADVSDGRRHLGQFLLWHLLDLSRLFIAIQSLDDIVPMPRRVC